MFAIRYLLPYLNPQQGRIVTVASDAHSFGQLNFFESKLRSTLERRTEVQCMGSIRTIETCKYFLFSKGLNDELKQFSSVSNNTITSVSLHPGVIGTNLWRYTPGIVRPLLNIFATDKSPEQGAATSIYACLVHSNAFEGGEYLRDCQIVEPLNQYAKDELKTLRKKLWNVTEKIIKENGFDLPTSLL